MTSYADTMQRHAILASFERSTTLTRAVRITGLPRELVYQELRAAEYRHELLRVRRDGRTQWIRRPTA